MTSLKKSEMSTGVGRSLWVPGAQVVVAVRKSMVQAPKMLFPVPPMFEMTTEQVEENK